MPKYQFNILILGMVGLLTLTILDPAQSAVYFDCAHSETSPHVECSKGKVVKAIYIYDRIDWQTETEIVKFDKELSAKQPFPKVYLNSLGGSIASAISIGRIFRRRKVEVWNKDYFDPAKHPICASACVIVAAGAVRRNLLLVGLHKSSTANRIKGEVYQRSEAGIKTRNTVFGYYREMGLPPGIEKIIKSLPYGKNKFITLDPLKPINSSNLYSLGLRMDEVNEYESGLLKKDRRKITNFVDNLKSAVARGDSNAAYTIGESYLYGLRGVQKNIKRALTWYEIAGDLGNPRGYHFLGVLYTNGHDDIVQDHVKSFRFNYLAALNGFTASQNNLAWAYFKGRGTRKNLYKSLFWSTKAVEGGDPFSYGTLGTVMLSIDSFADDKAQIYKWLKMAVNELPDGEAKKEDNQRLSSLVSKMTPQEISQGNELIKLWKPSRDTGSRMRDPSDK